MKKLFLFTWGLIASYICYSQDWQLATGFPSGINIYCITYDGNNAYAIGFSQSATEGSTIYSSSDKGDTWTTICTVPEIKANYILANNGRMIITGYVYDSYVMCYSDDLGKQWNPISGIGNDKLFTSVICHNNDLLAICGCPSNFISYKSKDNGRSWEQYFTFSPECEFISGIASSKNSLVAILYSQGKFLLMNSFDDGNNWALSNIDISLQSIVGVCNYNSDIYTAGRLWDGSNNIYVSKDGGKTFTTLESIPKGIVRIHSMSLVDNRLFIIATNIYGELSVCYKEQ